MCFVCRRYYVLQEYQQMYEKFKHNTPSSHPHPVVPSDKKKESPSQHHLGSYTPDSTTHYNSCETNNQMDMGSSSVNTNEQNYSDCSSPQAALFSHYHQQFPQLSIPKASNNRSSGNSNKVPHHHTHGQSYPANYMSGSSPYMGVIQPRPNQRLSNVNPPATNFNIQTALHMYTRATPPSHVQTNQNQPGAPGCSISKLQQLTNGLDMTPPPPMNLTPSPQPHNDTPPPHHYKLYPPRSSQQVSPPAPAPSPYTQFNMNGYRQQGGGYLPNASFMNQAYPSHDQQQAPMYPYSYINGNLMNMRR